MRIFIFIAALFLSAATFGQSNISFFHMQNRMPQNSNYNASYFPDAKVYVSLPVISGIDINVNNSFGINDVLTPTGDSTLIDIDRLLREQNKRPYLNVGFGLTDFMLGVRLGEKSHFSLFVNDRIDATIFYPLDLFQFIWEGNGAYVGEKYVADDFAYKFTAYREWGVGYARQFEIAGFNTNIGVRLKYLTGLFHSSTEDNIGISILTDETNYTLSATFHDATIRSAGISMLDEKEIDPMYAIHNGNTGFGVDLGANLQFSDKLSFGLAINDLGVINWKDYAEKIHLDGASFQYEGLNLDDMDNLADAFMDSLETIEFDTVVTSFKTTLNSKSYLTASYNVWKGGFAQASIGNYFTHGRMKSSFGIGFLQNAGNWLSITTTASIIPQHGLDVGGGLMLKGGFLQVYAVADGILNTINLPETKSLNIKFGINFLFGKPKKSEVKGRSKTYRDETIILKDPIVPEATEEETEEVEEQIEETEESVIETPTSPEED